MRKKSIAKNLEQYLVQSTALVRDAVKIINENEGNIALVVNEDRQLVGTITDGDFRRGVLAGYDLDAPLHFIMNKNPFAAPRDMDQASLFSMMQARHLRDIPIIDEQKRVIDIVHIHEILTPEDKNNWVVIMAGGYGKRLMPLTENTPKPMLDIGGVPVLEVLINSFIAQGFRRFYISVNYLADKIKNHFGDGKKYGVEIRYLEEDKPLDTGGSLSLIKDHPKDPFFVINGDIVTNVKFSDMLDFHAANAAMATIGVREHKVNIPYGVITIDNGIVSSFREKPSESYFVNTGIYVCNPDVLGYIKPDQALTMPQLLDVLQKDKKKVFAFPVTEYWLDIGRLEDFARAQDYLKYFKTEAISTK